jgi:Mg/Co/Ni transporter MgtE
MIRVTYAEYKNDYNVYVEFNNGTKGIINFKKILEEDHREIIRELLDKNLFNTVKVNLNTLCWDNEVDFAPDYLFEQVERIEKAA